MNKFYFGMAYCFNIKKLNNVFCPIINVKKKNYIIL